MVRSQRGMGKCPPPGLKKISGTYDIYTCVQSAVYRLKLCSFTAYENALKCSISMDKSEIFWGGGTLPTSTPRRLLRLDP